MRMMSWGILISGGILLSLAYTETGSLQRGRFLGGDDREKEVCRSFNGLEFCAKFGEISANSGEPIVMDFALKNISEEGILVKTNRDLSRFKVRVFDHYGNLVLSKIDKKQGRNASLSDDDMRELVTSMARSHRSELLEPGQTIDEKLVISDLYNLSNAGTYHIEVARHTHDPKGDGFIEISLEKIRIKVK